MDERLPPDIEASAYFILAESLTNVVKHAQATYATVRAAVDDGVLILEVRDDGVGGANPEGHGLTGLADRVEALGGRLQVESADGGRDAASRPPAVVDATRTQSRERLAIYRLAGVRVPSGSRPSRPDAGMTCRCCRRMSPMVSIASKMHTSARRVRRVGELEQGDRRAATRRPSRDRVSEPAARRRFRRADAERPCPHDRRSRRPRRPLVRRRRDHQRRSRRRRRQGTRLRRRLRPRAGRELPATHLALPGKHPRGERGRDPPSRRLYRTRDRPRPLSRAVRCRRLPQPRPR